MVHTQGNKLNSEAIRADVTFLCQRSQKGGGYVDTATDWPHSTYTWLFFAWRAGTLW